MKHNDICVFLEVEGVKVLACFQCMVDNEKEMIIKFCNDHNFKIISFDTNEPFPVTFVFTLF